MGHVKIDTGADSRKYSVKYTLNDVAGVKALLRDRHRISSARFSGDTAASDILIDLHSAIESASLTDRQAEAIGWVYGVDVTQGKAAEIMGVSRPAVTQSLTDGITKIASVYRRWEYGELNVNYEYDTAEGVAA